jgi:CMP/dCMP kinase
MIISFSGAMGSGKSTIAPMLAEKLGWHHYYMGGILREIAKQRNLTLIELTEQAKTDPTIDQEVDKYQKQLGKESDNFVIQGRTSWYLIPHSLKIFLDVSEEESARRIFADLKSNTIRHNEDFNITDLKKMIISLRKRKASEVERYEKYYGIDVYDKKNYDFVLDTTSLSIDEVFGQVLIFVKGKLAKQNKTC